MREGNVFKRCGRCNSTVEGKRGRDCGYTDYSWSFRVDIAPPHAEQAEVPTWSANELSRFLAWAANHEPRWGRVWHLVAHTGLRRGEVAQLAWPAVDLEAATVTVTKAKTVRGRRTIDLDPGTVAVLREHRAQQRRDQLAAGPAWREHGVVLAHEDGSPIHPTRSPAPSPAPSRTASATSTRRRTANNDRHSHSPA